MQTVHVSAEEMTILTLKPSSHNPAVWLKCFYFSVLGRYAGYDIFIKEVLCIHEQCVPSTYSHFPKRLIISIVCVTQVLLSRIIVFLTPSFD